MLVGSKEKKIKGQHLISWGTLLSVWNSKWSELNIVGFLKWWSLTSPSIQQRTWLNCCAWGTKTARTSTTCKSSWLGKWARSQKLLSGRISWDWWCRYSSVWTALRQKTYQAMASVPGGAIQCVAVTQHRHHILLFILFVNISLSILTWFSGHTLNCMLISFLVSIYCSSLIPHSFIYSLSTHYNSWS